METDASPRTRTSLRIARLRFSDGVLFACFAVLAGMFDAFLLLGWHDIDPANLDWLRGDPAVYQTGWEFLRHVPWTFPPTWIGRLDYPFGVSAAYLDVIPIVAVPLRLISGILPADFQYLGAYTALCLILQTYFGLKLLSRFTSDKVFVLIGAVFFLNASILLNRVSGHFSLCSQWLIVAALYYYFAPVESGRLARYVLPFAVLIAVAGGVTPYIAIMVLGIGIAALFRWFFLRPVDVSPRGILYFAVLPSAMLASFLVFGFLASDASTQLQGSGYNAYSMNLLGPINPVNAAWPMSAFDVLSGQIFEGYNYLGLGVILLGIVCLTRRPALLAGLAARSLAPVLAACVLFTLLALSTNITLGSETLFVLPLSSPLLHLLAVFRSSGRFFWPPYYMIMLGAIAATLMAFRNRGTRCAVLGTALLIQCYDLHTIHGAVAAIDSARYVSPLRSGAWRSLGQRDKHLILLPAWQCDPSLSPGGDDNWSYFATLAARSGMTLNSTHAARDSAQSDAYNCTWLPQRVLRGELADDTAYVLSDSLVLMMIDHDTTHYCRMVDGFNLCTFDPAAAVRSRLLGLEILPAFVPGTEFRAERAVPKDLLLEGLDKGPAPAIWTIGQTAQIYFRPVLPAAGDLLLEIHFGGYGALLTRGHPVQRAIVSVNGEKIGMIKFNYRGDNLERSVLIPGKLLRSGRVAEIRLDLPDAAAPSDLGLNDDGRLLGLYISRFRITGASKS